MFTDKMMMSPWDRWYSTSCCLCCHVRTGTIILGVWYMLINAVVLLILLTALSDPEKYHLTSAELANDLDVMDDASKYPKNKVISRTSQFVFHPTRYYALPEKPELPEKTLV
ncbi:lysosomal-associated transmembrane protein 4B-like [Xiphophorus hellerii]|uniref:lysosomal-associated transmembrane protein 4B-like n=1 Tax=Xiphophorus hellerii TaxID=8084 RepID=UPI0013B42547|nr:lysosomal-associated transmembrane protein 4B-like [Xiphophorus hellerii]